MSRQSKRATRKRCPLSLVELFRLGYLPKRDNRKPRECILSSKYLAKHFQATPNLPGSHGALARKEWSDQSHGSAKNSFSRLTSREFATRNVYALTTGQKLECSLSKTELLSGLQLTQHA